ncbi:MAG: YebC/PmpR family DNA-binding transcriptional regulator [Alphaproteobacteria bacterium CG_4_10_14_0_8_um_filter_37_21]|nr:MAG: YebC/PmpR family DNA-binding transcriptional regulator [Alphaproteobacteria bacterium CG_4_10_14_0_8_um_filter_37_21]
MAGHSQFKNIMHRKGAQDKKRARIFARLSREIMVAAKTGGGDPSANPRLRTALVAARSANMPKDNIDRAIKKATSEADATNFEEIRYEGYGAGGVAVIVEVLTDSRNRTASELRSYFSKNSGALGETGSVSFMFDHVGLLKFPKTIAFDTIFEEAVHAGADNVEEEESHHMVTCAYENFAAVRDHLTEKLDDPLEATITWQPKTLTPVDENTARSLFKMIDLIEDNDDVQNVFANFDIADDILDKISS